MDVLETDILILGAGLAGLRAALSAASSAPSKTVTIVSSTAGPGGSSFANRNNCLGMQVCFEDRDLAEFLSETQRLASPGMFDVSLARAMARESLARFEDLVRLGLRFRTDDKGAWLRYPACFSPASRRALVFDDLQHAFRCFQAALERPGLSRVRAEVLSLIQAGRGEPILGTLLWDACTGKHFAIRAGAVIMCLGGPASLFRHHVCGPGSSGVSYGLLHAAGAGLENLSFLQLMWYRLDTMSFFPLQLLARPGAAVGGARQALPEDIAAQALVRATHCPYGFGLPDNRIDRFVADYLLSDGSVEVVSDGETFRIAPMAHAGNGGATIDQHGRTSVPNLYACGECATGMHGANRIGGGMVLATQVFGHRAGTHAAQGSTNERTEMSQKASAQLANKTFYDISSTLDKYEYVYAPPGTDWIMTKCNYPSMHTNTSYPEARTIDQKPSYTRHQLATLDLIVRHHQSLS